MNLSTLEIVCLSVAGILLLERLICAWRLKKPLREVKKQMDRLMQGNPYTRVSPKGSKMARSIIDFFNTITLNLEGISKQMKSQKRLQKELNVAQKIQLDLLPSQIPKIPGLEIYAETQAASEIGGDIYDFKCIQDHWYLYLGDATGHGVPAGIIMIMVDVLLETFMNLYDDLIEILVQLNTYLKPHMQTSMFITLILGEWKPETQEFTWVGAGHEYVIHYDKQQNKIKTVQTGGIAVAMLEDNRNHVEKKQVRLEEGDILVLYTDGINEAKNSKQEDYGLARLTQTIERTIREGISSRELFTEIVTDVSHFMGGEAQKDDMTLIVIQVKSAANAVGAEAVPRTEESPDL